MIFKNVYENKNSRLTFSTPGEARQVSTEFQVSNQATRSAHGTNLPRQLENFKRGVLHGAEKFRKYSLYSRLHCGGKTGWAHPA